MNKTIFGLSFLNYNWDNNKKDIIDTYIPLVCECIVIKNYAVINRDQLKGDFDEIYGLNIPLGAIESILKRMVKENLLNKIEGQYRVLIKEVYERHKKTNKNDISDDYDEIINNIITFAKKNFAINYSKEEIECALLQFLKEFDLDIMLAGEKVDFIFSKITENKKAKYIISKFIINSHENSKKQFHKIVDIAQGHAIATLITFEKISSFTGNLNDVDIYLDAPIIFNLLGINGESNLSLSKELVSTLKNNGAKLKIFEINNQEVVNTITDAIERLKSGKFEFQKSSRVLKTAIRESLSSSVLQIKLNQVDEIYNRLGIQIVSTPEIDIKYSIDESLLSENIEKIYTKNGTYHLPTYKKNQIDIDVQTISYIYQIRRNKVITSLKSSKAILLTSNESIAFASKCYSISVVSTPAIPPCLTDIFLATILWSNYPSKNGDLNIKRLINECYANIEIDNKLLQRFYEDIEKMHHENAISDEQFYLLNSSNLTYRLLEKLTLNDIDEYTDKTPAEVVGEIISSLKHGEDVINKNVFKIAHSIAQFLFWSFLVILIILTLLTKLITPSLSTTLYGQFSWIISLLLACFGFFRWGDKIPPRDAVISFFTDFVYKFFIRILKKED